MLGTVHPAQPTAVPTPLVTVATTPLEQEVVWAAAAAAALHRRVVGNVFGLVRLGSKATKLLLTWNSLAVNGRWCRG